jgi:hypothetical protein
MFLRASLPSPAPAVWPALRARIGFLGAVLREPALWLLLALTLAAGTTAYLVPIAYTLDIGGSPGSAVDDAPYLIKGFNVHQPEYDAVHAPTKAFRWVFENARLVFPGVGRTSYTGSMKVAAGQSAPGAIPSSWSLGPTPLTTVPIVHEPRVYHLLLPTPDANLDLRMHTPPFQPANDPRQLGFAADVFSFKALRASLPARVPLAYLLGCTALGYALLRRWGVAQPVTATLGLPLVGAVGGLLVWERLGVTTFAPRLLAVLLAAYVGSFVLMPLVRSAAEHFGVVATRREIGAVVALAMLAWIIRLGGLLHPQAIEGDVGLNIHDFEDVILGKVIFTEGLPAEAGGGQAPYPPAQYVMLLPWGLVTDTKMVVKAGNTLADSLVIAGLWLLVRAAGGSARAGLFAGGLYLFAMPAVLSLHIGEMANVWGQALVMPLMVALLRWRAGKGAWWVLLGALVVALLGHLGVLLSLLIFFAVYAGLLLVTHGPAVKLGALVALALLVAGGVYYSGHLDLIGQGSGAGGVPFGFSRLRDQLATLLSLWGRIDPLTLGLGLAGLLWALRSKRDLGLLLLAWWLSTALSLGSLLWTGQALRWTHFLFPALAIGGGFTLALLYRRGRVGHSLAYGLLGVLIVRGALLWYWQIATYYH